MGTPGTSGGVVLSWYRTHHVTGHLDNHLESVCNLVESWDEAVKLTPMPNTQNEVQNAKSIARFCRSQKLILIVSSAYSFSSGYLGIRRRWAGGNLPLLWRAYFGTLNSLLDYPPWQSSQDVEGHHSTDPTSLVQFSGGNINYDYPGQSSWYWCLYEWESSYHNHVEDEAMGFWSNLWTRL